MAHKGTHRIKRGQMSTAQQKKVHVAPTRLGDGMKPNHAERICTWRPEEKLIGLDDMATRHQH